MSYRILSAEDFERKAKHLKKKYRSLKDELADLITSLSEKPTQGKMFGPNVYKIRLAIKSKGGGKSDGARVITLVVHVAEEVVLLTIYDKSDQSSISDKEIKALINDWKTQGPNSLG